MNTVPRAMRDAAIMPRARWAGGAVILFALIGPALAQSAAPATVPSSTPSPIASTQPVAVSATITPASRPADQGTPKDALRKLSHAMEAGDQSAILEVMAYDNALQSRMANVIARMAAAQAHLKQVSLKAFGKDGSRGLLGDAAGEDSQAALDSASEHIDGDHAIVSIPDGAAITLKRVDGEWKVPLGEISQGQSDEAINDRILEISHQAAIYEEAAAEVVSGKYKASEQVAEALRARLLKAATQPATQPHVRTPTTRP